MLRVPCLLLVCVIVLLCFHSPGLALGADVVPEPLSGAPAEAGSGPESGPSASPAAPTVSAASAADQASQPVQPDQQAQAVPAAQSDQGIQSDQAVPAQKPGFERVTTIRGSFVLSPKSVIFSADGSRFYVNALEGLKTLVYDTATLKLAHVISHEFTEEDAGLFLDNESTVFDYTYLVNRDPQKRNCFGGKPVEGVLTHADRYLWVTYYRRTWDPRATSPSAVAIIDTQSNSIVRVMPTGPLPKMLAVSPDGRTLALSADGRWIYVACNRMARLVMVDALNWKVVDRVPASPYPVGLAVHPDGTMVLTTAQGRRGRGGHVLDVFRVQGVKPLPVQPPAERPAQDGDREPDETDDETDDEQHVDTLSTW